MRICVIFNPTAKGDKARHFRAQLDAIGARAALKQTTCAGDARRLATEAVNEGFEVIVAAGGDGTVNEALNGLADAPDGFARARLGVLPLGTVNVLARDLGLPLATEPAWDVILRDRELRVDLPWVEWTAETGPQRRYFVQLAGAGLDARAIELVSWPLKKKIGPLAYVIAGLQALCEPSPHITVTAEPEPALPLTTRLDANHFQQKGTETTQPGDSRGTSGATPETGKFTGALVLLGNGRLYGGHFKLFPQASMQDGLLDACIFPRVGWGTLLRTGPVLLACKRLPAGVSRALRSPALTLTSDRPVTFEVDGELVGHLPAKFGVRPGALRLAVP